MQLCNFLAGGPPVTGPRGAHPAVVSGPGILVDLTTADPPLPADLGALLSEERAGRLAALAANAPETAPRLPAEPRGRGDRTVNAVTREGWSS